MSPQISHIKAFDDNYIWAIHNSHVCSVVDPGDHQPVIEFLQQHNLKLDHILITHHHYDHTGGIIALKQNFPKLRVYGPNNPNITGIDTVVKEHDKIELQELGISFKVLETPGHTMDHIAFFNDELVFCGDTLFSGGCGRMFEGTPSVFWGSLCKLKALPAHTKVYCTHEYTQANLAFASHIDPNNSSLQEYFDEVKQLRQQNKITLPSSIAKESEINPFLRCHSKDLQNTLASKTNKGESLDSISTFARLRKLKDNF